MCKIIEKKLEIGNLLRKKQLRSLMTAYVYFRQTCHIVRGQSINKDDFFLVKLNYMQNTWEG